MKISDGEEQSWVFLGNVLVIQPSNRSRWAEGRPTASSGQWSSGHRRQGVGTPRLQDTAKADADKDLGDVSISILIGLEKLMKNKCT